MFTMLQKYQDLSRRGNSLQLLWFASIFLFALLLLLWREGPRGNMVEGDKADTKNGIVQESFRCWRISSGSSDSGCHIR